MLGHSRRLFFIVLIAAAVPALAEVSADAGSTAWSPVDTVYVAAPIQVSGEPVRRFQLRERESLARTILRPEASVHRLPSPEVLLRELAGLEMRRYGGLGAFSTASLRGSGGQDLGVYLDGVDLRHPMSGQVMLGDLPLVGVERIEVYRGASPGDLGGGAPAGAIHLVSAAGESRRLALSVGSYGTGRFSAGAGGEGPWGLRWNAAAGWISSRSDFIYLDRAGTGYNSADDSLRLRRNADFRAGDLMARLACPRLPWGAGALELSYRHLLRENGVPGSETLPTYHTRSLRRGQDLRLAWRGPILARTLRLQAAAYGREGLTRFLNPEKESGPFLLADETRDRLHTLGLQLRADVFVLPLHLMLRAERRGDRFQPENLDPGKPRDYERRREALSAAGELSAELGRVFLLAGYGEEELRDNYYGAPAMPWLPQLERDEHLGRERFRRAGFKLRLLRRRGLDLRLTGNLADAYRAPTLLELFGQDVSVQGNPELRPERGWQRDLGLVAEGGSRWSWRLELCWFRRQMSDQILFRRNSQYSVLAENLAASQVDGSELTAALSRDGWALHLAATRLDAFDRGGHPSYDGKRLPYRSPFRLFARLARESGRLTLFAEVEAREAVFTDRYNDPERRLPASALLGAGLRWHLPAGCSLSLESMNLTDETVEDILGYPLPGRTLLATLEWEGRKAP